MCQITLRNIPEEIEKVVRAEAHDRGISLNKAFLSLLERGSRQTPAYLIRKNQRKEDCFSRFCGVWSAEESSEFDAALAQQRTIDSALWQ